jgi:hypothetical protein
MTENEPVRHDLAYILDSIRERIAQLDTDLQQQINDLKERMAALEKRKR